MDKDDEESTFQFVKDRILRNNLEHIADYVTNLYFLSQSEQYESGVRSSFRKTIIIYTAAEIEGVLLWILKSHKTEEECAAVERSFRVDKHIYRVSDSERIVLGTDMEKKQKFRFDNINLAQLAHLCRHFDLIDQNSYDRVQEVRKLRNRQHIGGLGEIDNQYTESDLYLVFDVAQEVKVVAKEQRGVQ